MESLVNGIDPVLFGRLGYRIAYAASQSQYLYIIGLYRNINGQQNISP